ncbi:helix-turn-helix domain-containing protein [Methylobacterium sp. WL120]|uniref:helix-turn-helix domain-containing protein n=1 Tax=Methylobacterium sp. WL120 TaxID=2603887 RepID=UPI0011CBECA9|nr:helix-turn-helix domain-containing protein [Methylobacterium sp. WL120]TXM64020.1 helix-turn-helix domain-containing protein [Methylobacterium sp. WL120]
MNYAYEIRRQAEAAPRAALPAVASAMWKAFGEGHLSEAEAEALSGLIEARQSSPRPAANMGNAQVLRSPVSGSANAETPGIAYGLTGAPRSRTGSRPRTDASMARRRRWAASGRLPPGLAARFTLAEQAVLAVIAVEVAKRGDCRLAVGHIAAVAGVSETMVRNAIREARTHGLLTVEERRLARFRSDTNVVCIVSREWTAWLQLARSGERATVARLSGGGCRSPQGTNTPVSYPVNLEGRKGQKRSRGTKLAAAGKPDIANSAL